MGMFGEVAASIEAKNLFAAIKIAVSDNNPSAARYCNKAIVPLFKSAKSEAFERLTDDERNVLADLSMLAEGIVNERR